VAQVAAIKKALGKKPLGKKPLDEQVLQQLVREGKLTRAELTAMSAADLAVLADSIEQYKRYRAAAVAPPGNAPGEFDLGQLDQTATPPNPPVPVHDAPTAPVVVEPPPPPAPPAQSVPATASTAVERIEFAKSSNVRAAELGADGVLTVEFSDGKKYQFGNFTRELFEEWQKAPSAGSWFHHNVRKKPERHPVLKG
jgi:hypothetical protein